MDRGALYTIEHVLSWDISPSVVLPAIVTSVVATVASWSCVMKKHKNKYVLCLVTVCRCFDRPTLLTFLRSSSSYDTFDEVSCHHQFEFDLVGPVLGPKNLGSRTEKASKRKKDFP